MAFIFFYPTKNKKIGGAQRLVVSFAKSLSNLNYSVKIIDYSSGYCYGYFEKKPNNCIEIISFDECESIGDLSLIDVDKDDVWVLFNSDYINFSVYEKIEGKILFYDLLYPNIPKLFSTRYGDIPFLSSSSRKKFFKSIIDKKALCVVDVEAQLWLRNNLNVHVPLVNIPVVKSRKSYNPSYTTGNESEYVVYVARACDWKVMPFLKVIEDLFRVNCALKFKIFTDDSKLFDSIIRQNTSDKIYVNFKNSCQYYEGVDMEEIIRTTNDGLIHFGMASVAVEFAINGLFTVSLDLSNRKLPNNYVYRYIYDGHDEGCITQDLSDNCSTHVYLEKGRSIDLIIDDAKTPKIRKNIVLNSKVFCETNHYSENVAKKLIMVSSESELTFDSYLKILNSTSLYKLYKIRKIIMK
ncbi:hypothetical protein [Vibrio sp. PID17_43]|uniref:hypothetical protein n=1 Tax=Vibrio sp. PID17_43 TaxID=1583451 RepID=UPI000BFFCD48|nr:hypothetical protein [Vibrio sp. PID17_43]PHJ40205.1 hypothetical protein AK965_18040 [Vibrio sp. PID17_43]